MTESISYLARDTKIPIAVVGAGGIGAAFSLVFATAGHEVRIYDPDLSQRQTVRSRIARSISDLQQFGLCDQNAEEVLAHIHMTTDIAAAVDGVGHVQECVPEDIDLKRKLFAELDELTDPGVVLASSSSAMTATRICGHLSGAHRCLVVHPGNPPFLIKVVEVVAAPFTSSKIVESTCTLLNAVGLEPVTVRKEIDGFVFNRLQGAILREAYCLVRDGVAGVEDVDRIVRDGLGLRWSVTGPFETADLNRPGGIRAHAQIMGAAYAAMGAERGQEDPWTDRLIDIVEDERRALLPLSEREKRIRWRDRQLMALLAARSRLEQQD